MDKLQFVRIVSWVSARLGYVLTDEDFSTIEQLIRPTDVASEPFDHIVARETMREMITAIVSGAKINAIRAHRMITKEGLKESKDEIERLMSVMKIIS